MNPSGSYDFIRELVYKQLQVPVYTESTYANQSVSLPVIIFSRTSTTSNQTMDGAGVYFDNVIFSIKAKTIEKVEELRDFLLALLDSYDDQFAFISETNDFNIDLATYTVDIGFSVVYK
jgi:hypothetical protein